MDQSVKFSRISTLLVNIVYFIIYIVILENYSKFEGDANNKLFTRIFILFVLNTLVMLYARRRELKLTMRILNLSRPIAEDQFGFDISILFIYAVDFLVGKLLALFHRRNNYQTEQTILLGLTGVRIVLKLFIVKYLWKMVVNYSATKDKSRIAVLDSINNTMDKRIPQIVDFYNTLLNVKNIISSYPEIKKNLSKIASIQIAVAKGIRLSAEEQKACLSCLKTELKKLPKPDKKLLKKGVAMIQKTHQSFANKLDKNTLKLLLESLILAKYIL